MLVPSADVAVFYFQDQAPYVGALVRATSRDDYYAATGYKSEAYKLVGKDGYYWELAFITPKSGDAAFWYLEAGNPGDICQYYLAKK